MRARLFVSPSLRLCECSVRKFSTVMRSQQFPRSLDLSVVPKLNCGPFNVEEKNEHDSCVFSDRGHHESRVGIQPAAM